MNGRLQLQSGANPSILGLLPHPLLRLPYVGLTPGQHLRHYPHIRQTLIFVAVYTYTQRP